MAEFYPYLIASLPTLHFGMKPPFSFERFLEACHRFIPDKDYQTLSNLPQPEHYMEKGRWHHFIERWIQFDTSLRNEIVKVRAGRWQVEAETSIQPTTYTGPSLAPVVAAATMSTSLLEGEKILDDTRWKMLDELAKAHYFDLDALICYAYKLLILHRWESIRSADASLLLKEALEPQEV
ncbi:MAG TPA: DUF2764 family protein [Methanoregulaceae archaeon]|nr:MAG: DUF2764 family protein [Methanolinea sp.]HON80937.1 DUF2764 family protein [Methanoregulaceae archaeon]HPD09675.1 DUF2764 family protein [Methanoregulaceae archaeon]HRT15709.1 DUF2764 family protein [Methanoregulaceae archaeon]HRU31211.1 DUF2764 family protein [Methanoregulaceae archaeon]